MYLLEWCVGLLACFIAGVCVKDSLLFVEFFVPGQASVTPAHSPCRSECGVVYFMSRFANALTFALKSRLLVLVFH